MDEFMEGRTPAAQNNGMGIAGFILALLSLLLCWIPFLNWILWILGLVFSIIGVTKPKKGLAIAGLVLCGVYLILVILAVALVFGGVLSAFI